MNVKVLKVVVKLTAPLHSNHSSGIFITVKATPTVIILIAELCRISLDCILLNALTLSAAGGCAPRPLHLTSTKNETPFPKS